MINGSLYLIRTLHVLGWGLTKSGHYFGRGLIKSGHYFGRGLVVLSPKFELVFGM